jgi:5'-deoxynucleotidase YfbR-like HD superfamily hydrolase
MDNDKNGCFQTYTGKRFDPFQPNPDSIDINDIAHSLSMLCRYNGHSKEFYSVAQHSVLVSKHVPKQYALQGLLHDASETYIADLVRPIKRYFKDYLLIEERLMEAVAHKFNLLWPFPSIVKEMDTRALITEFRDVMSHHEMINLPEAEPFEDKIVPVMPNDAEKAFLSRFDEIGGR